MTAVGAIREKLLVFLRGDYNSVRYRWFRLPREHLSLFFRYRVMGRSWIEFYADRMDGFQKGGGSSRPLKPAYLEGAIKDFEYIKSRGLEPDHAFLDYGCGVLRTGAHIIRYLESGRYVGVDISEERVAKGRCLLAESGIPEDAYTTHIVRDTALRELAGQRFDFVWAMSVINHMPAGDIRSFLEALRPLLNERGQFLFVFNVDDRVRRMRIKDWWYPESLMRRWCEEAGFHFEILPDYKDTRDYTVMARLSLPPAS